MRKVTILMVLLMTLTGTAMAAGDWKQKLEEDISMFGHRNWIVVADSAYPLQTSPGIETITVDADQLAVVEQVLSDLSKAKHVRPIVYTDSELNFVPEKNAKGVTDYREALAPLLASQDTHRLPHEQIIQKLDEAGKTFKVLIIKTPLTIPYTSVFFQLDCGYWSSEDESQLRAAMKTSAKPGPAK
jgi:D-ribose pyranose/furanose isomerase RbsD